MMRDDTMNFWNSDTQFLLGGTATEVAVTFLAWRHTTSRCNSASLITLTGKSKGND
jgi:hypothetical protein